MVLKYKIEKVDRAFANELRRIMAQRAGSGLSKMHPKELSMREATRLLMRTDSINAAFNEMRTKPKKYDV